MYKHETLPVRFSLFILTSGETFAIWESTIGVCVHKFRIVQMFFPPGEIVNQIKPLFDQTKYLALASGDFNPDSKLP